MNDQTPMSNDHSMTNNLMTKWWRRPVFLALFIACVALALRLPGLGGVMTVDEENWMLRSAEYYDELLHGDFGGTFLTTHPGSVPMWLIGAGEAVQEIRVGFPPEDLNLLHFRKAAVLPMMLAAAMMIGLITLLLARLFSWPAAAAAGLLLAAEPYLVGMTRIAHLDGLQGLLMLGSLLAFLLATRTARFHVREGLLAGILLGLARGFKRILAVWLLPVFSLVLIAKAVQGAPWSFGIRALGFVVGAASLVFWLSWPALWFKDDIGRSLARDYTTVVTDEHVAFDAGEDGIAPVSFYLRTMAGRLTPHVQLLVVGSLVVSSSYLVARIRRGLQKDTNYQLLTTDYKNIGWLFLYSIGFLILITVAAKKADRYAMPAIVAGPVIAGWAAVQAYKVVSSRYLVSRTGRYMLRATIYILLIAVILVPVVWMPHTLAYNNPFFPNVRPLSQQGWGEGLEEAAAWLNARPRAEEMYIASWYTSVMQTYFKGKTLSLSSRVDYRVQYLVIYRNMAGRAPDQQASEVLAEVRDKEPVHVVSIQGVPYVWIYETMSVGNFTRNVGELVGGKAVGQTVRPEQAEWDGIDIGFATYSSRNNTEDIVVHVRESREAAEDVRTVRVNAAQIVDNEWQRFTWEPIAGAAGREFYVLIESPASVPGNAVTVRYTDIDVRPGQLFLNHQPKEGDIAYRVPDAP
jgi:4-amino-4-deoxy-L-arabinose transferase-like glycosyltransferase